VCVCAWGLCGLFGGVRSLCASGECVNVGCLCVCVCVLCVGCMCVVCGVCVMCVCGVCTFCVWCGLCVWVL